jgi:signal transduction histidine kinase
VRAIAFRPRLPRRTIRLRLTLLYGGLFLAAGAALLAITIGLVANGASSETRPAFMSKAVPAGGKPPQLPAQISALVPGFAKGPTVVYQQRTASGTVVELQDYAGRVNETFRSLTAKQAAQLRAVQEKANASIAKVKGAQISKLLTESGVALGIMALASIGLGWLMAGRALRPVRTMSTRARGISERNLHERLALEGPDDELKELARTFDGLLGRLEAAFESQRRFVANASHELRTPITLERALVEVALADPHPTIDSMRDTCRRVLVASEQQERLIEALLALARSQRGLESRAPVDLSEVTAEVVQGVPSNGLRVRTQLGAACTTGDHAMVERLVVNLIENAVRYNRPGGWLGAWTGLRDGLPTLEITNAGPLVDAAQVDELSKPFFRASGTGAVVESNGHGGNGDHEDKRGLGLGLSIVQAISDAHGARLTMAARPEGGLRVAVAFRSAEPSA